MEMNDSIIHRGPDDDGIYLVNRKNLSIAMGMRRLSIIDLANGKQPISTADGQITIVFNGEIYNYLDLRNELALSGVDFVTNSDTEVILKLYEKEGESSFKRLDGMFAFSIFDKKKNKVFIARDFFGEKPMYYTMYENKFLWASELKSIFKIIKNKPEISKISLNYFLRLTYVPAPFTIYENIHKLEANHYLSYDLIAHEHSIHKIENEFDVQRGGINFESAKDKVKDLIYESVESRSIADVPIGTFLSGGVDSSIISLCLSQIKQERINTFSIGFKKNDFDETDKSRLVAKQINSRHHEFIVDEGDFKNNLSEILLNFDEPFSDTASLPTYLVSKKTREHVKVALTGDGGDEVFGGYNKYYVGKINKKYTALVPNTLHNGIMNYFYPMLLTNDDRRDKRFVIRKMLNTVNYDGNYFWDIISLGNTENQLKKLLHPNYIERDLFAYFKEKLNIYKPNTLTEYRFIDKIISLEGGMLPKVDRTSMLTSLECRAPFLNKKIWNFTNNLPEEFLIKGWSKKHILKEAFKNQFPSQFLMKSKQGFETPVGDWLRQGLKKELKSYIETEFLQKQGFFNIEFAQNLVREHIVGKKDNSSTVWALYCFQKWYCNSYLN